MKRGYAEVFNSPQGLTFGETGRACSFPHLPKSILRSDFKTESDYSRMLAELLKKKIINIQWRRKFWRVVGEGKCIDP